MAMAQSEKDTLRARMRRMRSGLAVSDISRLSGSIIDCLVTSELWKSSSRIGAYASVGGEVDLGALPDLCARQGKRLYLPHVTGRGQMLFCPADKGCVLSPGAYGIPCPPLVPDLACVPDLILVPGLAFDRLGNRLGMGGGFYDRFLAGTLAIPIGVAYQFQIVASLEPDPWDVPMHALLTETGLEYPHAHACRHLS